MNISSLLPTLPKFLVLLVALACTLPLMHAKVGEQENWYISKQITLDVIPSDNEHARLFYKDFNGTEKFYQITDMAEFGLKIWDINGSCSEISTYGSHQGLVYDSVVLDDQNMISLTTSGLMHRSIKEGLITSINFDDEGTYRNSNDWWEWKVDLNVTLSSEEIHPESLSPEERIIEFSWSLVNKQDRDFYLNPSQPISIRGVRFTNSPQLELTLPDGFVEIEPAQYSINLGKGLFDQVLEENLPVGELGGESIAINSKNKLLIVKKLESGYLFKIHQLEFAEGVSYPTLSFINKFTLEEGTAPGQIRHNSDYGHRRFEIVLTDDDRIIFQDTNKLQFYDIEGAFLQRIDSYNYYPIGLGKNGTIIKGQYIYNNHGEFITQFRTEIDGSPYLYWGGWTREGGIYSISGNQLIILNRAYRTKGLPTPNVIPQPVVRSVAQRPGTNILDIDFEIIDPDDDTRHCWASGYRCD